MPPFSSVWGYIMDGVKKINVVKPFTYYIDGCRRRDFEIGVHDVPYDCAAYAEKYGFTKRAPEVKKDADNGAGNTRRSKNAAES